MENKVKTPKKYNYSVSEVALLLGIHPGVVTTWAKRNQIPKYNQNYTFSLFAIERLKKERKLHGYPTRSSV